MSEQNRKRDPMRLPGEGTGIYGVDPLVFLKPGDNPEVDRLLEELKKDCDEGDPFYVDYSKRKKMLRTPANAQGRMAAEGDAREAERARIGTGAEKRGLNPRWLTLAVVAIVGPAITLLLVLLLMRKPMAPDVPREASAAASEGASVSTPHTAMSPNPEAISSTEASSAPATMVAPVPLSAPLTPSGGAGSSTPTREKVNAKENDPYETLSSPKPPTSKLPNAPEAAPAVTSDSLEKPAAQGPRPVDKKPEAEF